MDCRTMVLVSCPRNATPQEAPVMTSASANPSVPGPKGRTSFGAATLVFVGMAVGSILTLIAGVVLATLAGWPEILAKSGGTTPTPTSNQPPTGTPPDTKPQPGAEPKPPPVSDVEGLMARPWWRGKAVAADVE